MLDKNMMGEITKYIPYYVMTCTLIITAYTVTLDVRQLFESIGPKGMRKLTNYLLLYGTTPIVYIIIFGFATRTFDLFAIVWLLEMGVTASTIVTGLYLDIEDRPSGGVRMLFCIVIFTVALMMNVMLTL